jgi:hypothetical protein
MPPVNRAPSVEMDVRVEGLRVCLEEAEESLDNPSPPPSPLADDLLSPSRAQVAPRGNGRIGTVEVALTRLRVEGNPAALLVAEFQLSGSLTPPAAPGVTIREDPQTLLRARLRVEFRKQGLLPPALEVQFTHPLEVDLPLQHLRFARRLSLQYATACERLSELSPPQAPPGSHVPSSPSTFATPSSHVISRQTSRTGSRGSSGLRHGSSASSLSAISEIVTLKLLLSSA